MERINCRKCINFYITWEPKYPYGCRGFGMKSRQMPSQVVYKSSGKQCELFKKKITKQAK